MSAENIGIAATVLGLIVSIIGVGKWIGRKEIRLQEVEKEQKEMRDNLQKISALFTTPTGEPRFITYSAHDIISSNCRNTIVLEMSYLRNDSQEMRENLKQHTSDMKGELKLISDCVHKIAVHQASLAGRRKLHSEDEE